MATKQSLWCFVLMMLIANLTAGSARGQSATSDRGHEQTIFDAEPDSGEMHVKWPVSVPDSALQVLRDTLARGTLNCLKSMGSTPEQVAASWFLASAVHLNGPDEVDLIVLPNAPEIAKPTNPGHCLLPANGGPFWVLGPGIASGKYGLLLAAYAGRLEVLNSRANGYRDIETGYRGTTILYKFTVHQYQRAEKKTAP
jgi:hypothetical protein